MQVTIADDRPVWVKREDKWAVCFHRCPLYKKCSSHHGMDCKRLGGTEIPKIGVKNHDKQGEAKKKAEKGNHEATRAN